MEQIKPVSANSRVKTSSENQLELLATETGHESGTQTENLPELEEVVQSVPQDRFNLVYIILIIHGIGTIMPWNMIINANNYFVDYKLTRHYGNGTTVPSQHKEYFLSYLCLAAQLPNVLCSLVNAFVQLGDDNSRRIASSIAIESIIIALTIVLAAIDTTQWTSEFFYLTMLSVVIIHIASGIYQNSMFGLASKLPKEYVNTLMLGANLSGTFTSVANIVTIWVSPNLKAAAIYYFSSALFVLLVCLVSFTTFRFNRFYRYYVLDERIQLNRQKFTDDNSNASKKVINSKSNQRPPYLFVLQCTWKQCLNVFLLFFVSLTIFPVIQTAIEPLNEELFGDATTSYFSAVSCFLVFNVSALFGNLVPNCLQFPGPNRLWIAAVLRLLFIPFFLFCNFAPKTRVWPVVIQSDWLYLLANILFAFTSGYFSSLAMMYAPRSVPSEHAGTAGRIAAACLALGIFVGINFSSVLVWLVKQSV